MNPYLYQQGYSFQSLAGRMVNTPDEISANDVPMVGSSFFPKYDMSEIYVKRWTAQGTIETAIYTPINVRANNSTPLPVEAVKMDDSPVIKGITERVEKIEKVLAHIKEKYHNEKSPGSSNNAVNTEPDNTEYTRNNERYFPNV